MATLSEAVEALRSILGFFSKVEPNHAVTIFGEIENQLITRYPSWKKTKSRNQPTMRLEGLTKEAENLIKRDPEGFAILYNARVAHEEALNGAIVDTSETILNALQNADTFYTETTDKPSFLIPPRGSQQF